MEILTTPINIQVPERPRPAYKGIAYRWKSVAIGLGLLCLILAGLLILTLRGNLALQKRVNALVERENAVTITPIREK